MRPGAGCIDSVGAGEAPEFVEPRVGGKVGHAQNGIRSGPLDHWRPAEHHQGRVEVAQRLDQVQAGSVERRSGQAAADGTEHLDDLDGRGRLGEADEQSEWVPLGGTAGGEDRLGEIVRGKSRGKGAEEAEERLSMGGERQHRSVLVEGGCVRLGDWLGGQGCDRHHHRKDRGGQEPLQAPCNSTGSGPVHRTPYCPAPIGSAAACRQLSRPLRKRTETHCDCTPPV